VTWRKTAADRQRDNATYGTEYRRAREIVRRNANGYCAGCGHKHPKLECDHIVPTSQGGTHAVSNLRMLCKGSFSCQCHEKKTATEGGRRGNGRGGRRDPQPTSRITYDDPPHTPRTQW